MHTYKYQEKCTHAVLRGREDRNGEHKAPISKYSDREQLFWGGTILRSTKERKTIASIPFFFNAQKQQV